MTQLEPLTTAELDRLRALVDGPAHCPSCGESVDRDSDICPCEADGVSVEPLSHEFLTGPVFADRDTVARLIALVDAGHTKEPT